MSKNRSSAIAAFAFLSFFALAAGAQGDKITLAENLVGEAAALADSGDYAAGFAKLAAARKAADMAERGHRDHDDDDDHDDDHKRGGGAGDLAFLLMLGALGLGRRMRRGALAA